MKRIPNTAILFVCFIVFVAPTFVSAGTPTSKVELPTTIHFLTPAGDDVEVGPGIYQVKPTESWLKLIREGEGPESAVLLDATSGTHEEKPTDSKVRLETEVDNPDVFHLAVLKPDGVGLEATGTVSGIRPRGLSLTFLKTTTTKSSTQLSALNLSRPKVSNDKMAPEQEQQIACGPVHTKIPRSAHRYHKPALAIHQNQLYVMAPFNSTATNFNVPPNLFVFNGRNWVIKKTTGLAFSSHQSIPAIASFQNRLHVVYPDGAKNLKHRVLNGYQWGPALFGTDTIPNQTTKAPPSLAVFQGKLHMVHLGKSSNTLWHATFDGQRWTPNAPIPNQKSHRTPDLAAESSRMHMAYLKDDSNNLMHTQFTGNQWTTPFYVKAGRVSSKSSTTPALTYNGQIEARLELMFSANNSDNLRSALYGIPEGTTPRQAKWFDERGLLNLKSEGAPAVVFYQGCVHLVYRKGGKLWHSKFSPEIVHPSVR